MEPYEHESDFRNQGDPYHDYYSTGGIYRPPKKPKKHGVLVFVVGIVLLCVAGSVLLAETWMSVLQRAQDRDSEKAAVAETVGTESDTRPEATPERVDEQLPRENFLGTGAELIITDEDSDDLELPEIYKRTIPSVVSILATTSNGTASGTGIILSADGYIVTNYHVVTTAEAVNVILSDGREYRATRVGGDETSDLMVLKIDETGLTPATFGDSESTQVGETVVAIGDPLGIELRGTMTRGIICGIHRDVVVGDRTMTLMQTDAALNSGNSGGPLVNMKGQVIGINALKLTSGYTAVEGIGFAIPISDAKPIVDELMEKGFVSGRPAIGITVETLDSKVVLYYRLPGRLCIASVDSSSDAYKQGVEQGDVIIAINGHAVSSTDEFNTIKNDYAAGDTVTLTLYRDGEQFDVDVKLMDRADMQQ
ncbi:MAG: trypsin-like peptidase domain-containing protein [Oscillospiraceae bacterium]|nr:trypsin-like peptidase domain-containing protein [Oscillospiraceae bacterium]